MIILNEKLESCQFMIESLEMNYKRVLVWNYKFKILRMNINSNQSSTKSSGR